MKVLCGAGCRRIFDIQDERIVFTPVGMGLGTGDMLSFSCTDCLKEQNKKVRILKKNELLGGLNDQSK